MPKRRYAQRKYLVDCSDEEVLTKDKVDIVFKDIVSRIPPKSMCTLNRVIAEAGFRYYTVGGIQYLIRKLKRLGLRVRRISNKRYVVIRD